MASMSLDELRVIKQEMVEMEREARQVMQPLHMAGVLISMYQGSSLERRALSYVLVLFRPKTLNGRLLWFGFWTFRSGFSKGR